MMRLRQRVDSRRVRWVSLCRAVELSLEVLRDLEEERSLAWFTYRGQQVYAIWDKKAEELVTVLGAEYRVVEEWLSIKANDDGEPSSATG